MNPEARIPLGELERAVEAAENLRFSELRALLRKAKERGDE